MVSGVISSVNPSTASWLNNACGQIAQEFIEHGTHRLSADMRALLLHVKRRTLDFGKQSEQVSLRQIINGLIDGDGNVIAGGLYVGESKARALLKQAITEGWLIAAACKNHVGGDAARSLSLNLRKIATSVGDRLDGMIARLRSTARAVSVGAEHIITYMTTAAATVKQRLRARVNAAFYATARAELNEDTTMNQLKMPRRMRNSRALDPEEGGFENQTPNILTNVSSNANREDAKALPSPARRVGSGRLQSAANQYDTVEEVVRSRATRAAARQHVADASLDPKKATIQQAQAVIDVAIRDSFYAEGPRVLVSIKAFGLLKKNAKAAEIEDMRDFIRFAVTNWDDIRSRHTFGIEKARREGAGVKATLMPQAPDAWALATRFNYFLRFYRDKLIGAYEPAQQKIANERTDALQKQVDKQARHILALTQERGTLIERARRGTQRQDRGPIKPFGYKSHVRDESDDE